MNHVIYIIDNHLLPLQYIICSHSWFPDAVVGVSMLIHRTVIAMVSKQDRTISFSCQIVFTLFIRTFDFNASFAVFIIK